MKFWRLALTLAIGLAADVSGQQSTRSLAETSVVLNFYGLKEKEVLQKALSSLAPLVRSNDVFVFVSGNRLGEPDIALVASWAEKAHQLFPQVGIWALTSGLANVKLLAEARDKIPACVTTIIYDYEPNWDNEPEFAPDFDKTVSNFIHAAEIARAGKFAFGGAPTGRPLLRNEFASYTWDYGKLAKASEADVMIIQTQTYCKKGITDFRSALAKLKAQQLGAGLSLDKACPQVTVDLSAPNGTTPAHAAACIGEARREGFSRISLWFAPARVENAVDLLTLLGRGAPR